MALINHNINNLSGGVSKQPDEARFDNQVEEMINFEPYITGSIRKRNPLEAVNTISTHQTNMTIHSYDRGDGLEKYGLIIDDNGLRVYDEAGNPKTLATVGTIDPMTAWTGTNWKKDIRFLTVGDTTWVLNKNSIINSTSEVSPTYTESTKQAFYWLKRSFDNGQGSGYTYHVVLNGVKYTANNISTTSAAASLTSSVRAAGYTVELRNSVLRISHSTTFTYEFGDSWGDQASVGWRSSIANISDLPADMNGFSVDDVGIVEITGTDRNNFTSYYLKWDGESWVEAMKSGLLTTLDSTTLPAKLVRLSDGTFAFGFNENLGTEGFETSWELRKKGDDDSNPLPSFVGNKISNMFFFRNRLGFTSEENVILSEVGAYYNFMATTVIEVLDGDPIDVSVDSDTVSLIRNVNAVAGSLTLWADNSQFVLSGGDILSPATTRVSKTSSYSCDNSIAPVVIDNEILFFNKIGDNLEVMTYSASSLNTDKSTAESISTNVLGYLPSTINRAVVASASNLLFLLDSVDKNTIYVYKYHVKGNEKIMSAWFKWKFTVEIKEIEVLGNVLFLLIDTNSLAKIELSIRDIASSFLDMGITPYRSEVLLSKFNIETRQGTRIIREPFYVKNVKTNIDGMCDLEVINTERNNVKTVKSKHLSRKLFIGGNSEKTILGFSSEYDTGCNISTLNLEGIYKTRSKNY